MSRVRAGVGRNTKNVAGDDVKAIQIQGFLGAATSAGLRYEGRDDLAIILSEKPARAAGVFTQNRVKAAPVLWCQEIVSRNTPVRAIIINSGIANACTGTKGYLDVVRTTKSVARTFNLRPSQVLVASTGIIGRFMDMDRFEKALPELNKNLEPDNWDDVARAIMTTDTVPKLESDTVNIDSREVHILGIAKGSGMIAPNMATLLAFVMTDAVVHREVLQSITKRGADLSFNRITVDGDTSTNDSLIVLANGTAQNKPIVTVDNGNGKKFQDAINRVFFNLAQKIVNDGEGATKSVKIRVIGALKVDDAKKIAFSVANSPLVKTAIHGSDANWGRILAAIGKAGPLIDPTGISLYFDDVSVVNEGMGMGEESERAAEEVFKKDRFVITIDLGLGISHASVFTCDLSPDYIKINASYRT